MNIHRPVIALYDRKAHMSFLKKNGKYYETIFEHIFLEGETDNDGNPLFEHVEVLSEITKDEYEAGISDCGCI